MGLPGPTELHCTQMCWGQGGTGAPPWVIWEITLSSATSHTPCLLPTMFPLLPVPLSGSSQATPSLSAAGLSSSCTSVPCPWRDPTPGSPRGWQGDGGVGGGLLAMYLSPGCQAHFTDEKTEAPRGRYCPADLPNPGIEPRSSALQVDSLLPEPSGSVSSLFGRRFQEVEVRGWEE